MVNETLSCPLVNIINQTTRKCGVSFTLINYVCLAVSIINYVCTIVQYEENGTTNVTLSLRVNR